MNNNCGSVAFNDFTCDNPSDKQCAVLTKCMYTFHDIATKKCWFSCKSIMGTKFQPDTPEKECYIKSKAYLGANYNNNVYQNCLNQQKRLIQTYKAGYCRVVYGEKKKINGEACIVAYHYERSRKIIHSITCNGKTKIVNKFPINYDKNCIYNWGCKAKSEDDLKQCWSSENNTKPQDSSQKIKLQNKGNSNQQYNPKFLKIEDNQELIKKFENMN